VLKITQIREDGPASSLLSVPTIKCLLANLKNYVTDVKPSFLGRAVTGLMDKLID
jgi:hypothetical protein